MKPRHLAIITGPVISEKATSAGQYSQHVFRVRPDATKQEIRSAVEAIFQVQVQSVRTLNQDGKAKRFGGRMGRRNHWKKAYISLAPGQSIALQEGEQG